MLQDPNFFFLVRSIVAVSPPLLHLNIGPENINAMYTGEWIESKNIVIPESKSLKYVGKWKFKLGMGWGTICTQNAGIARMGGAPCQDFFWGFVHNALRASKVLIYPQKVIISPQKCAPE